MFDFKLNHSMFYSTYLVYVIYILTSFHIQLNITSFEIQGFFILIQIRILLSFSHVFIVCSVCTHTLPCHSTGTGSDLISPDVIILGDKHFPFGPSP